MKKGFTLIELLAVIIILGIILIIAIPNVQKIINQSRRDVYLKNEKKIIEATKEYLMNNLERRPNEIGNTSEITLAELKNSGLINKFKDQKGERDCNGYILVTKISADEYDYTPHLNCVNDIGSSSLDGLVGHWKLDGNALDYSLNNNHGTISGAISAVNRFGTTNRAMSFDGTNDYINLGDPAVLNLTTAGTIMLWAKSNVEYPSSTTSTNYRGLISKSASGSVTQQSYFIDWHGTNSTRNLRGQIGNSTTVYGPIISNFIFTDWHHIAMAWDNTKVWLYVDSVLVGETPHAIQAQILPRDVEIGRAFNSSHYWHGLIDDLKIYNRALTGAEITHIYNVESYRDN